MSLLRASRTWIVASILSPVLLHGQLNQTTSSVTVTASEPVTALPSQAIFSVTLYTPITTSLSDAVTTLAGTGIVSANLAALNSFVAGSTATATPFGPQSLALAWTFQLYVPFSTQKATAAALAAVQTTLAAATGGSSLSFSVSSAGYSAGTCDLSGLVASARTQAQTLASAAGEGLGVIIGLTSQVTGVGYSPCSLIVKYSLGYQFYVAEPLIVVNATAPATTTLDQASILLSVNSGLNTSLDDVTSALQTAGISGTTLTSMNTVTVYTTSGNQTAAQPALSWSFQTTVPLSGLNAALAQLAIAQQAFQKQNPNLILFFNVGGAASSQPAACPEPALLASAKAQAQLVAQASGVKLGMLLNLSTPSLTAVSSPVPSAQGSFSAFNWASSASASSTVAAFGVSAAPVCTMNAQFQLQ